jgi:hypothetical protein
MPTDPAMQALFNRLPPEVEGEREARKIALEEMPAPWTWEVDDSYAQPIVIIYSADDGTVWSYQQEGDFLHLETHFQLQCRFAMLVCAAVNAYQEPTP